MAYYQFNEGMASANNSGLTTLPDLVSNNDGTLTGFTLNGGTSNWTPGAPINQFLTTEISLNAGVLTAVQTASTYQWIDCDTNMPINGATAITFIPTVIGNYAVEITELGCTQRSVCINVSTLSNSRENVTNVKLRHNPSSSLVFDGILSNDAQIVIYSLSGKEIHQGLVKELYRNTRPIANGLYMVTLSQNGASKTFKWIKE
ncbi:T9SS type A sorting domain-containing protein [Nonlabens mediterrranea]|uniref:T9SS type A sorting domain-containing protein n=1 Tax=Nonlabens mediterrranea TaxID=1419947 RepID=A0ABS0A6V3_9FLAO|nr:T9SS type A sorting domain-containing protein [Nonlabens mediterrranea]